MSRRSALAAVAAAVVLLGSCDGGEPTAPENLPPTAQDLSLTIPKGQPYTVELPAGDADGDPLTYEVAREPANGTIRLARDGSVRVATYTPAAGFVGTDGFAYRVSDGESAVEGTVTLEVVDRPPRVVAAPGAIRRPAAREASVPFEVRAWDPDGDTVFVQVVQAPATGEVHAGVPRLLAGDTFAIELTFSAPAGAGGDAFQLAATDGRSPSAAVAVAVEVNGPPAVDPVTLTVPKASPVRVVLAGSDPDGDPLTFSVVAAPEHGALSPLSAADSSAAQATYRPAPGFSGSDAFQVVASDGYDLSEPATVSIHVLNEAPVAEPQEVEVRKNGSVTITLAAADPDGDELAFAIAAEPRHGVLSDLTDPGDGTATVVYTPHQGFDGEDSFRFTVSDGDGSSGEAEVRIEVDNRRPRVTAPDTAVVAAGGTVHVSLSGRDADGDALEFSVSAPPDAGEVLSVTSTGPETATLVYLAPADTGVVSLEVVADDGSDVSRPAEVVIRVGAAPTADAVAVETLEDGPVEVELRGADAEGGPVAFEIAGAPASGTLGTLAPGDGTARVTYTPSPDFNGTDSFTYRVTDGSGLSAEGTVEISVTPVNDAPSFTGGDVTVEEDPGPYSASFAVPGPPNEAAQDLTVRVTSNSNPALFAADPSVSADGTLSFTLEEDAFGTADLAIEAVDDGGTANGGDDRASTTIRLTVEPVNDPPVIRAHLPTGTVGARDTVLSPRAAPATFDLLLGRGPEPTEFPDFLDVLHPGSESGQVVTLDFIPEDPALLSLGNWYEDDDLVIVQEDTWPKPTMLVEIIAFDSVPGAPAPMDTTRLQMRVRLNEGPAFEPGGWTVTGEEGSVCIPVDLPSSAEVDWFQGWEDMDGDGDVDSELEVTNENSAILGEFYYTDEAGSTVYIGSGETVTLPLGTPLCFEPREYRHSTFDPTAGEFEPYAYLRFRPVDDLGDAGSSVTVDIVVTPVY